MLEAGVHDLNQRGAEDDHEERGENKDHEREQHLERCFLGLLTGTLSALVTQPVALGA